MAALADLAEMVDVAQTPRKTHSVQAVGCINQSLLGENSGFEKCPPTELSRTGMGAGEPNQVDGRCAEVKPGGFERGYFSAAPLSCGTWRGPGKPQNRADKNVHGRGSDLELVRTTFASWFTGVILFWPIS